MNAICYSRVSTDEQADRGYSLDSQIKACRKYAQDHNMNIVAEITDDYTGSTLDRPGFNELEIMLARKEADAVVIYTSDRLSRNAANTLAILEQWHDDGIELHYCDRGKVKFDEEGIVTEGFPALVDHWERIRIRKRTMKGRYDKAEAGKPVMNGTPPYGYRKKGIKKDAILVKYEPELKVVRDIFEWYINGNGTGSPMSLREIARKLNKDNVPSTTQSKDWSNIAVHRILSHEIYAGTTYYGKTRTHMKGNKKIVVKLPKDEWIKIPVPNLAIIDRQTFEAAEARKERNRQLSRRNRKRKYLMSGHFRCGTCGQVMTGYHRQGYLRYQCSSHWPKPNEKPCPNANRSIITYKVDDLVWDWLCQLLTDDVALEDGLNKMIENNKDQTGTKRRRLDTLKKLIRKGERNINRLMSELNEGEYEDEYTRNLFRRNIKESTYTIKELQKEHDLIEAELSQVEITTEFRQEIKIMAAQIRDKLSDATFEGKRAILDKLDVKVVFRNEETSRWLDATCSLRDDPIALHPSRNAYLGKCERSSG